MKQVISFYKGGITNRVPIRIPVGDYLLQVRDGSYKSEVSEIRAVNSKDTQRKLKSYLPIVRYQSFKARAISDESIEKFSGIIYLDFDAPDIAKAGTTPELLKADLSQHECVLAAMLSCSGGGVCCLALAENIDSGDAYREAFRELADQFSVYCEVDSQTINPSRANFVTFDPEIFINEKAVPYSRQAVQERESKAAALKRKYSEMANTAFRAFNPTEQDIFHQLLEYCRLEGLQITKSYSDWVRMGFAIFKVFGNNEEALDLFHEFSRLSPEVYDVNETEKKFHNICSNSDNRVSVSALLRDAQKLGFKYDAEPGKVAMRNLEPVEYAQVVRNIKIGIPKEESLALYVEDPKKETVIWLYEKYKWQFNAYREKVNEKTGEVALRLVALPLVMVTAYVHQHHKPRWSIVNGYEVLFEGSYEICRTAHENMIRHHMAEHRIACSVADVASAIYQEGKYIKYEPLKDYFDTITTVFSPEEAKINAKKFIQILEKHNRVDTQKITMEQLENGLMVWGVYAVAQAMGEFGRVNDTLLGFVSTTQGTGKTQFVNALKRPFEKINMAGDAREAYNLDRDGKRKMMKNFILFDDEDVGRNKQEVENIKKCLSLQDIEFVEKYDKQDTRGKRICSYVFSSNNPKFLKEKSRRELIISFVENVDFDPLQYHKDLSNDTLVNSFWAHCWYEAMNNMDYYEIKARELQKFKIEKNEDHIIGSNEKDLIAQCFSVPEVTKGGRHKAKYFSLLFMDIVMILEAFWRKRYGGIMNTPEVGAYYQKADGPKLQEYKIRQALRDLGFKTKKERFGGGSLECFSVILNELNADDLGYLKGREVSPGAEELMKKLDADGNEYQTHDPHAPNYHPF
jgi:hypothetical protein